MKRYNVLLIILVLILASVAVLFQFNGRTEAKFLKIEISPLDEIETVDLFQPINITISFTYLITQTKEIELRGCGPYLFEPHIYNWNTVKHEDISFYQEYESSLRGCLGNKYKYYPAETITENYDLHVGLKSGMYPFFIRNDRIEHSQILVLTISDVNNYTYEIVDHYN